MPKIKKYSNRLSIGTSNDIVWDGEDLPCIALCEGDTVSEVVYKLAKELCVLKATYDLKDLDLKTVFKACIACPQPVKTLKNVFQLIINKIETLDNIISKLGAGSTVAVSADIALASCFLPRTNASGDPITKLPHEDYTRLIATMVCSVVSNVNGIYGRITATETAIAAIQNQITTLGNEPLVSPVCVTPMNTPIAISAAFVLLEKQFCQLKTGTGLGSDIVAGISKQPSELQGAKQLSGSNGETMAMLSGWKSQVSTLADSIPNIWLTIKDMRGALQAIQDNCCKINCDSIVVDFDIKLNDERTIATLFFAAKCKIPVGFKDCNPLGNLLTITDAAGASMQKRIKIDTVAKYIVVGGVMTEQTVTIDFGAGSPLDPHLDYSFKMDACMTNGEMTCQKCITKSVTYKDTCSFCEITVTAGHNTVGELVIIYEN